MKFRNLNKDPYKSIQLNKGRYISTGMPIIDNALNDLAPSLVTVLSGRSNEGKTTFVRQLIANAIDNGVKCLVINGEGHEELWINDLYKCVVGKDKTKYDLKKVNKRYYKEPNAETLAMLQDWHKDKLTTYHATEMCNTDELFREVEKEVTQNKHELIVIDNLMSLLNASSAEKYTKQGEFVQHCHNLAVKANIHIVLVVHPNKEYRKDIKKPIFEMISGNSDIYNKADNIIWVARDWDNENAGKVYVIKSRYFSEVPEVDTYYDAETGMLCQNDNGKVQAYKFNINIDKYITLDDSIKTPFDL